ncbi:IclR family transcriptional regulator [Bosea sp. 62]|nr:IclR family transcriptional regulator [Bosea sp. 21B]CAD5296600.1 IclR family transcriptional regulator [Bosea sp. 46]VVT61111.1 DNA-binding transcriptional regulator, IclR family [Bosea sp. EC-HK365B]VXB15168.1 IclR family transcriptional regulator [Bosea sp. 125]VXB28422.1 IclR family transcriptional regulator [Bosea sp. 127]VXC79129.1 IclR family transcriptional regulator [Bosea sp. 29B]VXC87562.1 IclR family transcriptional regulator [Bosea sp. 62]
MRAVLVPRRLPVSQSASRHLPRIPAAIRMTISLSTKRSPTIQSVSIAARFLDILAKADGPLVLGEIARRARTGSSTAHRYMQSLVREGLAAQDDVTGHYDLGPVALSIGVRALRRIDAVEVAARTMKTLASAIAASCGVAIWTERGPTIVRWYRNTDFALSTVTLGDVLPVDNTACGFVFQAHLPKEAIAAARKLQPASFRGSRPPGEMLDAVRREGGAELNEHLFSLLTGKAAPVFNALGEIACVVTTVSFVKTAEAEGHREALFAAARAATRDSGGA